MKLRDGHEGNVSVRRAMRHVAEARVGACAPPRRVTMAPGYILTGVENTQRGKRDSACGLNHASWLPMLRPTPT